MRHGLDRKVVEQARAGDRQAQATVLARLEPTLRAFFVGRLGPRPDVDDLVQNTLLRVYNGLPDLQDPDRLKPFAMKAALFELQDYFRGRYRPKERLYDPDQPPAAGTDAASGADLDLERALAALPQKTRRIIELRAYGYRYEEIARVIGTTEAAVKMQVKRAFEKMRSILVGVLMLVLLAQG